MTGKLGRVLIVEDVDAMRFALEQLLAEIGLAQAVSGARNLSEARLEVMRRRPDLVLLDEVLPEESSLDFLRELAAESIPVVLMTSMEVPPSELPEGAALRISKPDWETWERDRARIQRELGAVVQLGKLP